MNFNNINMNDIEKMMKMFRMMQEVFGSEEGTNINNEIKGIDKTDVDIEPVSNINKEIEPIDDSVKEKMKVFKELKENAEWEQVLKNRKNSADRWCKNQGRIATEEDKNNILKKLNGGKPMSDEDIDNVLKGIFPDNK